MVFLKYVVLFVELNNSYALVVFYVQKFEISGHQIIIIQSVNVIHNSFIHFFVVKRGKPSTNLDTASRKTATRTINN